MLTGAVIFQAGTQAWQETLVECLSSLLVIDTIERKGCNLCVKKKRNQLACFINNWLRARLVNWPRLEKVGEISLLVHRKVFQSPTGQGKS